MTRIQQFEDCEHQSYKSWRFCTDDDPAVSIHCGLLLGARGREQKDMLSSTSANHKAIESNA